MPDTLHDESVCTKTTSRCALIAGGTDSCLFKEIAKKKLKLLFALKRFDAESQTGLILFGYSLNRKDIR